MDDKSYMSIYLGVNNFDKHDFQRG